MQVSDAAESGALVPVDLIVVPYDDGRRGWRMGAGPDAFIEHGLPALFAQSAHDPAVHRIEASATDVLDAVVALGQGIAMRTRQSRAAGHLPVVLSGCCTATVGAVAGIDTPDVGVVWLDAHGDLNTPATSPSGFLDGMAAAMLLGWCHDNELASIPGWQALPPDRLLLVGSRAFDAGEREQAEARGVRIMSVQDVARPHVMTATLDHFVANLSEVYVHLDLDVLDPGESGPANMFAAPDGLALRDVARTIREIAARRPICGLAVSAYDPAFDPDGRVRAAAMELVMTVARGDDRT